MPGGWESLLAGMTSCFSCPKNFSILTVFRCFIGNPASPWKTENRFGISTKQRVGWYQDHDFSCTFEKTQKLRVVRFVNHREPGPSVHYLFRQGTFSQKEATTGMLGISLHSQTKRCSANHLPHSEAKQQETIISCFSRFSRANNNIQQNRRYIQNLRENARRMI